MRHPSVLPGSARTRLLTLALGAPGTLILLSVLAACQKEEKAAAQSIRPDSRATEADIGFRVHGNILERPVDVGTEVNKGDLIARLDPQRYRQASAASRRSLWVEPIRTASCCLGDGREILLLLALSQPRPDEEPLCRGMGRESEVYRFHLAEQLPFSPTNTFRRGLIRNSAHENTVKFLIDSDLTIVVLSLDISLSFIANSAQFDLREFTSSGAGAAQNIVPKDQLHYHHSPVTRFPVCSRARRAGGRLGVASA